MGAGVGVSPQAFAPCEIWLEFADGEYLFRLGLKQLAELQEKCDAAIGTIYMRVLVGEYKAEDLFETIRLGLIGGAKGLVLDQEVTVTDGKAIGLVKRYVHGKPLEYLHTLTRAILGACIHGYEAEGEKRPKPLAASSQPDQEPIGSTSPRPTQTEQV